MFRIRRVFDDLLPIDAAAISRSREILTAHFPAAPQGEFDNLTDKLRNPLRYRFCSMLFVAESSSDINGVALMLHAPDVNFCFLDYLAATPSRTGRGVGSALYMVLREQAQGLGAAGIFCECLPDSPVLCREQELLRENAARLRFYERCGMRVVEGTAYATPLCVHDRCPPVLLYDGLGKTNGLPRSRARRIVRAILERKYAKRCPPGYIDKVVSSFLHDPVRLRPPLDSDQSAQKPGPPSKGPKHCIALVVSEGHKRHHVHERGYVESPVRVESILIRLQQSDLFAPVRVRHFPERLVTSVHDAGLVQFMKRCCDGLPEGKYVYPYVFPVRNAARPPLELAIRSGYYCIDTFTPLHRQAYAVARQAVDAACTAAQCLLQGYRLAYALVRPPGHHAERRVFGGFCYLNNTAIAAHWLSGHGRVAVLDIDYHHGNGTQDIFYRRNDVLTLSLHGPPGLTYPYFSGFTEEKGEGAGKGFNRNFALPENLDGQGYRAVLRRALVMVERFRPAFLVVALGLDTSQADPTGSWSLRSLDFQKAGRLVGGLGLPTLVVQEGGYRVPALSAHALRFFIGLREGLYVLSRNRRRK